MARIPTSRPPAPTASAEDEVLIREIDEAVREDALLTFLREHGWKLLGGIVALIAALGAYMLWHNWREGQLEAQSEALISALDYAQQRDFATSNQKIAPLLNGEASPGARAAARFIEASNAIEERDPARARVLYKAIASDPETPPALRDLALLREVTLGFDRMKPAEVIARLAPLAKPGQALFGSAAELVAMAHLETGNRAEAGKLFAAIAKDESLSETLRSRARQMAGLLGVDAVEDVGKLLKEEGAKTNGGNEAAADAAG